MTDYYSTFIPGLQEVVKNALSAQLGDVKTNLVLDGLITYQSDRPLQRIKKLRFLNNSFLLLHLFTLQKSDLRENPIELMMRIVLRNPEVIPGIPRMAIQGASNFRIMASKENQTEPVNRDLLVKLEKFFSYRLGLTTNRSKPDLEIWFLTRSEGYGFVGLRLTRMLNQPQKLERGELRPELANLLCYLSEPAKDDIFLDPFAGSGSIPIERARAFPYREVIAGDKNDAAYRKLSKRISKIKPRITLGQWDALDLGSMAPDSISKIVTDPPWGIYTQPNLDLEVFYSRMLDSFFRVLRDGGLICLLMGQKEWIEKVVSKFPGLVILNRYDILVSGKKAAIYKIRIRKA